jgi:prepilin-type N-terminal cleavage/methylation domain-containing protein
MRRGFTFIEIAMVIAVFGIISTLSVPLYRRYQIRNDLAIAKNQVTQGLARAKFNAQAGKYDDVWSFYVPRGALFKGKTYTDANDATINEPTSEVYPMPSTIALTGLTKVTYSKMGIPDRTGIILLRAITGEEEQIAVVIDVRSDRVSTIVSDMFDICLNDQTLRISDATWPYYQSLGATMGACGGAASSTSSLASSSSSSSVSGLCNDTFIRDGTNKIIFQADTEVHFDNRMSYLRYGQGGPPMEVHVCYKKNTAKYSNIFAGVSAPGCESGEEGGFTLDADGGESRTINFSAGDTLSFRVRGYYRKKGLAFDQYYESTDGTGNVRFLQDGDAVSTAPGFDSQPSVRSHVSSSGWLDAQGKLNMCSCRLLMTSDIENTNGPEENALDFQDDVLLVTLNTDVCS